MEIVFNPPTSSYIKQDGQERKRLLGDSPSDYAILPKPSNVKPKTSLYLDRFGTQVVFSNESSSNKAVEEGGIVQQAFSNLADNLCQDHSLISTNKNVLGGIPHIANTRLSVGRILAKLYVLGSVEAVLADYAHLSAEQVKAAIAYAQDFLEAACDTRKPSQGND